VTVKKITPSGSKCCVPAAPVTGPLKSPVQRNLTGFTPSNCELVHIFVFLRQHCAAPPHCIPGAVAAKATRGVLANRVRGTTQPVRKW
jgi:hypothetical protein